MKVVLQYVLANSFKFVVRITVLFVSCLTMSKIMVNKLGYRMDLDVMLFVAAMLIVLVRVWMPWEDRT